MFQRTELQAEKKKALSDEAKRLFREDPGLFKAAEEDFKSICIFISNILLASFRRSLSCLYLNSNRCHTIVVDLPPGEKLDDLASLLQLDTKNMDVRQLGIDVIKEQQRINLKFSSSRTAVLPEDKAQIMLAAVSNNFLTFAFERLSDRKSTTFTFERI